MPGLFGGSSQPVGASGTGTGSTANVYTPYNQPGQDVNYNNFLQTMLGSASAGLPSVNPAGISYAQAAPIVNADLVASPYAGQSLQGAETGAGYGAGGAAGINNAANAVLQSSIDPQNALFARQQQQVLDQSNAANAAAGVGSSPYGAGLTSQALSNFDTNWQNQQLQRQLQGLSAATSAYPAAANLAASSANLPFSTLANQGSTALGGLSNVANLGQGAFALPQQGLNDIQSYLGLGQAASGLSGQLGNLGINQATQGLAGLGNLVGGIGGLGGIGNAIGSLPSAGTTLLDTGTDFAGGGASAGSGILGALGGLFGLL